MPQKKKKNRNSVRLSITYFLSLILAVSVALPAYIQSNFLKQFVSLKIVSVFFIVANLLTVVAILFYPSIIKKLSNYFTIKLAVVMYFISLFGLALAGSSLTALVSIILFSVASNLIWINMDVVLEGFSANSRTGRIRTTYLTFANLGWVLAPNFSGYLVNVGGYKLTFLFSALIIIIFFLVLLKQRQRLKDKIVYPQEKVLTAMKKTWKNKNLRGVFFISLLLSIFYSSAVVYIPVYLHQTLGMDWGVLGIIFSIMLLPFILIELPAGIIADKYIGEKEMMVSGILILTVSLFLFFYIDTPSIWLWALVLFLSRIGAALLEAMRETYFFKIVDVEDIGLINLFRTTNPLGYIVGPGLAIIVLYFFPIHYIFLILGIIMLFGLKFIAMIKDTK